MQEQILDKHRDPSLRVYAVWYAMYPGDARAKWRADVLPDPRATHWWDTRRLVGRDMLTLVQASPKLRAPGSREFKEPVLWDAYLLFDRQADWDRRPMGLLSWGYTILSTRDVLDRQVRALVQKPGPLKRAR